MEKIEVQRKENIELKTDVLVAFYLKTSWENQVTTKIFVLAFFSHVFVFKFFG
jgi:hypothetical protein